GEREPVFETRSEHGHEAKVFKGWKQVSPGTMTPQQYDAAMADLVGFLQWMGEPAQAQRFQLGVIVLIFLGFLTVFAWRLNAAYWKDVK
ncbi:MAG TPA: cytochrome c1, partial [Roseateles sp.]|uniref:cytochrome c1 n=1 Tax=Roseateles sp. TaxID=1971397 RepID=UPI002ED7BC96